jgi:hypothetical protein
MVIRPPNLDSLLDIVREVIGRAFATSTKVLVREEQYYPDCCDENVLDLDS